MGREGHLQCCCQRKWALPSCTAWPLEGEVGPAPRASCLKFQEASVTCTLSGLWPRSSGYTSGWTSVPPAPSLSCPPARCPAAAAPHPHLYTGCSWHFCTSHVFRYSQDFIPSVLWVSLESQSVLFPPSGYRHF